VIHVLVGFARLVAGASTPQEVLPLLAEAAVERLGADAAAVVQIGADDQARLAAAHQLPGSLEGWQVEADTIGPELGQALLGACAGAFAQAHTLPLVAGGNLFGVLVLLSRAPLALEGERLELAEALTDLAAMALGRRAQLAELQQSDAELRSSTDTLARTEKLRALGQLAGGIPHDLLNILNPLTLQLQLLRRRVEKNPAAALETIANMEEVVRAGVATVERLRNFSRQTPERGVEPTDLNRIVTTAIELGRARASERSGITLVPDLGTPPPVQASASELLTAVVNLVLNAIEAMPGGGRITVRSGADGAGGFVEVADDGPGMPPEVEKRVFEPFFTTKSEGTGLGLAMVYSFVERQRGQLTLRTAPGEGTTFRLWFPRVAAPV
jgi:signal transduction histidine kinase